MEHTGNKHFVFIIVIAILANIFRILSQRSLCYLYTNLATIDNLQNKQLPFSTDPLCSIALFKPSSVEKEIKPKPRGLPVLRS